MAAASSIEDEWQYEQPSADDYAALCTFQPVPDIVGIFANLDRSKLSPTGKVDALVAARRISEWAAAQTHACVAEMVRDAPRFADPEVDNGKEWVREEVACALALSPDEARGVMVEAVALVTQFPATLALLAEGEIRPRHASELVRATAGLDPTTAAKVEARVFARAPLQTVSNYKRSLSRAVHALDPRSAEQKHAQGRAERRMWTMPLEDGMARLGADLPAEDAAVIATATEAFVDQVRRLDPNDARTKEQLRADALTHFALSYLNGGGGACDKRPTIGITINVETLAGCDDQPAELDGFGPISAGVARRIASDPSGTWRRLLTDKAGKLLDYQQRTYKPPTALREHVRARDRRCRFSRCRRRAKLCDLDHRRDWQHGGTTCVLNLECLCERHHVLKHETGWRLRGDPENRLTWISPTGHAYSTDPPPQPTAEPAPDDTAPF